MNKEEEDIFLVEVDDIDDDIITNIQVIEEENDN